MALMGVTDGWLVQQGLTSKNIEITGMDSLKLQG
jgi:hypothetical protein